MKLPTDNIVKALLTELLAAVPSAPEELRARVTEACEFIDEVTIEIEPEETEDE